MNIDPLPEGTSQLASMTGDGKPSSPFTMLGAWASQYGLLCSDTHYLTAAHSHNVISNGFRKFNILSLLSLDIDVVPVEQ